MKMLYALAVMVLSAVGCGRFFNKDQVKAFAVGTFVSSWQTDYSQSRDTIQIEYNGSAEGSETFLIIRRTFTEYTGYAKKREPSYKITKWTGVYLSDSKTIAVQQNGRSLSFDPSERGMTMGVTVYKKI